MSTTNNKTLEIPTCFSHEQHPDIQLPIVPTNIKETAVRLGWAGVGIMVALVTEEQNIMMLIGRETPKYRAGTLGPLGETSKQVEGKDGIPPLVEQPLSTLYRGLSEELGVTEPEQLGIKMKRQNAWRMNQWPRGDDYPNQWNCAISFAIHIPKNTEALFESIDPHNDEVAGIQTLAVDEIMDSEPSLFRAGVQDWLWQLSSEGLITPSAEDLQVIDFSSVIMGSKDVQIDQ